MRGREMSKARDGCPLPEKAELLLSDAPRTHLGRADGRDDGRADGRDSPPDTAELLLMQEGRAPKARIAQVQKSTLYFGEQSREVNTQL